MYYVDIPKVKGKMGEKDYTITSLSDELNISRNTLASYLENPKKIPYEIISEMASILCDSPDEARKIFFRSKLT
ncbi:hypothetical protein [Anaerotruncus rubiinfantis]|uniref:hypothetical protein n=1 Tax=Anaerotruncus rubiinfantis TaxID=1720200 RepID=UPI0034A49E91